MCSSDLATIVGQSGASALTGAVADGVGAEVAMWLPTGAAGLVVLAALVNALLSPGRAGSASVVTEVRPAEQATALAEHPAEHL